MQAVVNTKRFRGLQSLLPGVFGVLLLWATAPLGGCAKGNPAGWPCGSGERDDGEECDGDDLAEATCESLGRGTGTLACGSDCRFDTSGCGGGSCGNGMLDPDEACDGDNLGGHTCITEFFTGGTLVCGPSCQLDTSGCNNAECGNGVINPGEACDDGGLVDNDGCSMTCKVEPGWTCTGQPSLCTQTCGNGTIDFGENCEGTNLNSATCVSLLYDSGTLACGSDCLFDTSGCVGNAPCGNGLVEATEECDLGNLDGETCVSLGYDSGVLACTASCTYDKSLCAYDTCGNAAIDTGEECDGSLLNGGTCVNEGFASGTLSCSSTCVYNTSGCVSVTCGNSAIDAGEDCDTGNLNSKQCTDFSYDAGTLACNGDCSFNFDACTTTGVCGDGTVNPGEECDDDNTTPGDGCDSTCHWESTCSQDGAMLCNSTAAGALGFLRTDDDVNYLTACSTNAATDAEDIWGFTATNSGQASLHLEIPGLFNDYDVYVMEGACNPDLCIAASEGGGGEDLSFAVLAGRTYFIMVERYALVYIFDASYSLQLTCP